MEKEKVSKMEVVTLSIVFVVSSGISAYFYSVKSVAPFFCFLLMGLFSLGRALFLHYGATHKNKIVSLIEEAKGPIFLVLILGYCLNSGLTLIITISLVALMAGCRSCESYGDTAIYVRRITVK